MKRFGTAVLTVAVLAMAATSFAAPPLNGTYQSTDLGGTMELGRYSEGFAAPEGGIVPGTTYNAQSWDGATLANQWWYYCGTMVSPPMLLTDTVDGNGNGNRTYMKTYVGGFIWLSGTGPWANGDPQYTGIVDSYTMFETITYASGIRIAAVFNIDATGHFDNYAPSCMSFAIGNGSQAGSTDWGDTPPADYPPLLEQGTCDPVAPFGTWWDMHTLTMTIKGCTVPVEETTWGAFKSMYAE